MAAHTSSIQCPRPRKLSVLAQYQKTALTAFKSDCEMFLEQFEKENTFNYANFANIWQLNNFTCIYADQNFVGPLQALCEVCFLTAKKYLMFQKSLYIKVGAFYLLYGLYYKQPIEGMVKIRLTRSEYASIKELMDEMLNREQYDILYIFAKMKADNVFLYTAEPKPLQIELKKSIKNVSHLDDTFQTRGAESSVKKFQDVLEDEIVKKLEKTCTEYDALLDKYSERHRSVSQFKSTIISDLKQAHATVFAQVSTEPQVDKQPADTQVQYRESLRFKAMQNTNAEYRGSKKVLTAIDLEVGDDDDEDDTFNEEVIRRSMKRRSKRKSK